MSPEQMVESLASGDTSAYSALVAALASTGTSAYFPQTHDELWECIYSEYGFAIPRIPVCDGHVSPFDCIAQPYFGEVNDCIVIGPRSGGKTLGIAILAHLLIYRFGIEIASVGAIEEQANRCYRYFEKFATSPHFRDKLAKPPMLSKTFFKPTGVMEIMPATMNRVNSPHPNRAHLDEVELFTEQVLEEAKSMPIRQMGRAPATLYTSSRKFAFGPMEDLLAKAGDTGMPVLKFCAFEIVENCPPTRHKDGVGCETCPLHDICKEKVRDEFGREAYKPGPGRASRAGGWLSIDDLIAKFTHMDRSVFDSQWLALKPESKGLAFPMFEPDRHVIQYEYDPTFPTVCGIDFGFTNPSCVLYAQLTMDNEIVVFAEDYGSGRTTEVLGGRMLEEPWFGVTRWRVADSADKNSRETLINMGIYNEPAGKQAVKDGSQEQRSSRVASVDMIRALLDPSGRARPLLYVARQCKNLIREMKRYHHPDARANHNIEELPAQIDDHAVDALRYMIMRMYRGSLIV